jgi:nitrile hydratase accessory protein
VAPIPGGEDGPVFPAPWSARAFALAVALNDRGLFSSSEWAEALAAARAAEDGHEPEAYWRAWMAALEELLGGTALLVAGNSWIFSKPGGMRRSGLRMARRSSLRINRKA